MNIALSNAACAMPAFALGSWYDPTIGSISLKSSNGVESSQRSLGGASISSMIHRRSGADSHRRVLSSPFGGGSSSSVASFRSRGNMYGGNSSVTCSKRSTGHNPTMEEGTLWQIQDARMMPLPSWLLLGNTMSANTNDLQYFPCTTMLIGHCLPADSCSFPTSLQLHDSAKYAVSVRGVFSIQALCGDAVPEELEWKNSAAAVVSSGTEENSIAQVVPYLKHIFQSQAPWIYGRHNEDDDDKLVGSSSDDIFVSSVTYTYQWDKYAPTLSQRRRQGKYGCAGSSGSGSATRGNSRASFLFRALSRTFSSSEFSSGNANESEACVAPKTPSDESNTTTRSYYSSWRAASLMRYVVTTGADEHVQDSRKQKHDRKIFTFDYYKETNEPHEETNTINDMDPKGQYDSGTYCNHTDTAAEIMIPRLIHAYEILARSTSVWRTCPEVYADVRKSLQPLRQSILGMQRDDAELYDAEIGSSSTRRQKLDEEGEFLFGPSSEPVARILLNLHWTREQGKSSVATSSAEALRCLQHFQSDDYVAGESIPVPLTTPSSRPSHLNSRIPTSISVQCAWDDFVKQPVVINPLSAHVRYVFASYIYVLACFRPHALGQDLISPSKGTTLPFLEASRNEGRLCGSNRYRPYVGNTTHKLVAALKAMLAEQLSENEEDEELERFRGKPNDVINPVDYKCIVQNVHGILHYGGLWTNGVSRSVYLDEVHGLVSYGSPLGRLLSLFCFYMSRQASPRMMMVAWNVFVDELRSMWENRQILSNMENAVSSNTAYSTNIGTTGEGGNQKRFWSRQNHASWTKNHDFQNVDRTNSLLEQKLQVSEVGVLAFWVELLHSKLLIVSSHVSFFAFLRIMLLFGRSSILGLNAPLKLNLQCQSMILRFRPHENAEVHQ